MTERRSPAVVELVRLVTVVFFAGLGFELARLAGGEDGNVLGPFDGVSLGVIVGSGIGYVLGGVLGRTTITAVDRVEHSFQDTSAESIVAGVMGGVAGIALAAAVGWPLFLIPEPYISSSLFVFVLIVCGYAGMRIGRVKQQGMLALFGARAGIRPQPVASVRPRLVDSSVAIDGRVLDVVRAGFLHGEMLVCRPVLEELQGLADAGDDLRRGRGRRGLEVLEALAREPGVSVTAIDDDAPAVPEVDAKLVRIALDREAALLTLDTNLAKSAALAGVVVLNLHALALAVRAPVQAGDDVTVLLLKPGREAGQAIGYLDDGTMVVAERSRERIGAEVRLQVTSVLTTANGRMVFGRPVDSATAAVADSRRRPR